MTQKITSISELQEAIAFLEVKQDEERRLLKEEFKSIFESLKPLNIIKKTFEDFKENLLGATVGMTAGYVSKAVIVGATHNPVKRILGSLLQLGISTIVSKNPDGIKSAIASVVSFFRKKKAEPAMQESKQHNY